MRQSVFLFAAFLFGASPALAQERSEFDAVIAGIRAGRVILSAQESGGRYSVTTRISSGGLVRGLFRFDAEGKASGRVKGNAYTSGSYDQKVVDGDGTQWTRYRYSGGRLKVTYDPPKTDRKDWYVGPERQGDALDPLTALWALLRDRPADLLCGLDESFYNGEQRVRLRLSGPTRKGDTVLCTGKYIREAGYSAKELAEKRQWTFQMTYRDTGAPLLRLEEVRFRSDYGPMAFRRR